jgi:hypothetical protein
MSSDDWDSRYRARRQASGSWRKVRRASYTAAANEFGISTADVATDTELDGGVFRVWAFLMIAVLDFVGLVLLVVLLSTSFQR